MTGLRVITALVASSAICTAARAQEAPELRGRVVSAETGGVVAGAWIALEGRDWGTVSWNDGHFYLPEIPEGPGTYEVSALGYEPEVLTLDPAQGDLVVELTPEPGMLEGVAAFMAQVERRRNQGGQLRVFDRQALAFNGAFDLGEYLTQQGVTGIRKVCLDERPETVGVLGRESSQFYMAESVGGYLRLYTEDFVDRAARERLELQREPEICSGPVNTG